MVAGNAIIHGRGALLNERCVAAFPGNLRKKIRGISFICASLIVLLHAYNQNLDRQVQPLAWSVEIFLSREIGSLAVPMFFVISGFLLAWYFLPPMGTWYRDC